MENSSKNSGLVRPVETIREPICSTEANILCSLRVLIAVRVSMSNSIKFVHYLHEHSIQFKIGGHNYLLSFSAWNRLIRSSSSRAEAEEEGADGLGRERTASLELKL